MEGASPDRWGAVAMVLGVVLLVGVKLLDGCGSGRDGQSDEPIAGDRDAEGEDVHR